MNMAIREKPKFTKPDSTFERGNKYLGIYTFFISDAFEMMELKAVVVDSELNEKIKEPDK